MQNKILSAALAYAARGWHVLPLKFNSKLPATQNGLHDATGDSLKIESYFKDKTLNLGIRTGQISGIVVLDIDQKGGGWDSITPHLRSFPLTYTIYTPNGGAHLYYKAPAEPLKNKVGILPGVDFRAEGGYVVASPSTLDSGTYEADFDCQEIADLPQFLLELIRDKPQPAARSVATSGDIPEGGRNDYLARAAGAMRNKGMSAAVIYAALSELNLERCNPPLDDEEVETIARSVGRYTPENPIVISGSEGSEATRAGSPISISAKDLFSDFIAYISDKAKVKGQDTGIPGLNKLLGGGYREKELIFLSATAKTGKSSLLIQLIYNLLEQGVPVGFASAEMDPASEVLPSLASIKAEENSWLEETNEERTAKYKSFIDKWPLEFLGSYGTTPIERFHEWVKICKSKGIKYFFADHAHFLCSGSEDHKLLAEYVKQLKYITMTEEVCIVLVVQPSNIADGQQLSMNKLRGGANLSQVMNALLVLERHRGPDGRPVQNISRLTLDATRSKLARPGHIYLEYDPVTTRIVEVHPDEAQDPQPPLYGQYE